LRFVGGDPAGIGELPGRAALRPPCQRFAAAEVEALDAVVAAVGDEHEAAVDRDASSGGLGEVLGGAEVELPRFAAAVSPGGQEGPGGAELLDPVVAGGDDLDISGGIDGPGADR